MNLLPVIVSLLAIFFSLLSVKRKSVPSGKEAGELCRAREKTIAFFKGRLKILSAAAFAVAPFLWFFGGFSSAWSFLTGVFLFLLFYSTACLLEFQRRSDVLLTTGFALLSGSFFLYLFGPELENFVALFLGLLFCSALISFHPFLKEKAGSLPRLFENCLLVLAGAALLVSLNFPGRTPALLFPLYLASISVLAFVVVGRFGFEEKKKKIFTLGLSALGFAFVLINFSSVLEASKNGIFLLSFLTVAVFSVSALPFFFSGSKIYLRASGFLTLFLLLLTYLQGAEEFGNGISFNPAFSAGFLEGTALVFLFPLLRKKIHKIVLPLIILVFTGMFLGIQGAAGIAAGSLATSILLAISKKDSRQFPVKCLTAGALTLLIFLT